MSLRYEGKITLVTGAARGIGKGCVLEFVKEGAIVVFCDIRDEPGKETEAEINAVGPGKCSYVRCDVTNEEEVKALINLVISRHGQLDCLINIAGCLGTPGTVDSLSVDDFRKLLEVNLVSHYCTAKYALPHLRKTKGNIINMSSIAGSITHQMFSHYCTSKGGVIALTRSMAVDEAKHGVRVNCVSPGFVEAPMALQFLSTAGEGARTLAENYSLLGRMGTTEEVSKAIMYLAADATFATGLELKVSGGTELGFADKCK